MPVETPSLFARVIQDHLELKRRNAELEPAMPIDGYRVDDPFDNHPLFKTEEQARLEETMDGDEPAVQLDAAPLAWPGENTVEDVVAADARAHRRHRPLVEVTRLRLGRLARSTHSCSTHSCHATAAAFTRAGDRRSGARWR